MGLTAVSGFVLTAISLGVTHGIEPDHVAGITALTHKAGDPKLSAIVGGCFAIGHAVLVIAWIGVAYLLFGMSSFPDVFKTFGMLFVGVVLSLLSIYLGVTGTRKLVHRHSHDHGHGHHSHYHVHRPGPLRLLTSGTHDHDHGLVEYLKLGLVGALFTLSPPVSMIAFISVMMSTNGESIVVVVATYAISIIGTMAVIGGGSGSLFRISKARGERVHAGSQILASVLVLAFAVNLLVDVVPGLVL